jgi:hypothetical protein
MEAGQLKRQGKVFQRPGAIARACQVRRSDLAFVCAPGQLRKQRAEMSGPSSNSSLVYQCSDVVTLARARPSRAQERLRVCHSPADLWMRR